MYAITSLYKVTGLNKGESISDMIKRTLSQFAKYIDLNPCVRFCKLPEVFENMQRLVCSCEDANF